MNHLSKILFSMLTISSLASGYITDSTGVPMRDGIRLGTDLYFPVTSLPPWPTLLQRTPYDRDWDSLDIFLLTDVLGYALVVQNQRGYGDSEGEPMVFFTDGWGNLQDGYDAIEWIADRFWSDGKIGMIGASAHGMTQYYAAGALPPHLVCCGPMVAAPSLYQQCPWVGGEFRKALTETWLHGVGTPWLIDTVCNHPNYDTVWTVVDLSLRYDVANYPMFHIGGWYDLYTDGYLEAFSELQKRYHNQKIFIGPWGHGDAWGSRYQGDLVYPENAEMSDQEFLDMLIDWYDNWLKGKGSGRDYKVKFYLMGSCDTQDTTRWNHWVETDTWPLPDVVYKRFYLRENGLLDSFPPPQTSAIDSFQYDPADPCTTYGGREFIGLEHGYGPIDQNPIENRSDVLVYSTPPLQSPLTVVGKLKFILYAASDCYDTDWTIRVTDVYPDGRSILMTDGILMARHRHGFDREDSLIPGLLDTFNIDLWSIAQVFDQGHRLRIILSSSNYPRFEKNPNTGAPFERDPTVWRIANQEIYRSTEFPSHLLLPVLPEQGPHITEGDPDLNRPRGSKMGLMTVSSQPVIHLHLDRNSRVEIELLDVCGRKLWSFINLNYPRGDSKLILPHLSNGIYFVHSKINGDEDIIKTVVIR